MITKHTLRTYAALVATCLATLTSAQDQLVVDVPYRILPVAMPDGGFWAVEHGNWGAAISRIIRFDANNVPTAAFELAVDGEVNAGGIRAVGLPNGHLFVCMPQYVQNDQFESVFTMPMLELDDAGTIVWQSRVEHTMAFMMPPVLGQTARLSADELGNVFIVLPFGWGGAPQIVSINNGAVQWWKYYSGTDKLTPDGLGGAHAAGGPLVVHFGSSGEVLRATRLEWSGNPVSNTYAKPDANGNVHVLGWTYTGAGGAIAWQVLDPNGALVEARTYSPFNEVQSIFGVVSLDNDHEQVLAGRRFLNLDATGQVINAFKQMDGSAGQLDMEFPSANQHLLVGGLYSTTDFFGNVTSTNALWRADEDMSSYCDVEPFTATRVDPPLSTITVTDVTGDPSLNFQDVGHTTGTVAFTVQPIALPTTGDLCAVLSVPDNDEAAQVSLSSSVLPVGGTIQLTSTHAGEYPLIDAAG